MIDKKLLLKCFFLIFTYPSPTTAKQIRLMKISLNTENIDLENIYSRNYESFLNGYIFTFYIIFANKKKTKPFIKLVKKIV